MTNADQLIAKAEKKASSSGGWFSSSSSKYEEAADLYQQAANAYKVDKKWRESGMAFEKEADCRIKSGEPNDAINAYHNAAKSFKKSDPEAAVSSLHQCIQLLIKAGNFRQAADREKEIAEVFDQDNLDPLRARDSFVRAGDWYKQEEANATANTMYSKAAERSADVGDYAKAIELYEQVGDWSLGNSLTKYSVKDYWLRAALCSIAMGDLVTTNRLLSTFAQKDVTFPSTREYQFASSVMDACEQGDVEAFQAAVFAYDQTRKLNNFETAILLATKRALEAEQGGLT